MGPCNNSSMTVLTMSPTEFFDPQHLGRVMAAAAA